MKFDIIVSFIMFCMLQFDLLHDTLNIILYMCVIFELMLPRLLEDYDDDNMGMFIAIFAPAMLLYYYLPISDNYQWSILPMIVVYTVFFFYRFAQSLRFDPVAAFNALKSDKSSISQP
jgi:hypothetical protein